MNLKPLGDRVIVKQDEVEETTASGLILSSGAQDKPSRGTVVAVGEGKMGKDGELIAPPVNEGDSIIYSKYGGTEVKLDNETLIILRMDDVLAICG